MIFGFLALDYVDWLQLFFICLILGLQRFKIRGDVCFLRLIKLVFSKISLFQGYSRATSGTQTPEVKQNDSFEVLEWASVFVGVNIKRK